MDKYPADYRDNVRVRTEALSSFVTLLAAVFLRVDNTDDLLALLKEAIEGHVSQNQMLTLEDEEQIHHLHEVLRDAVQRGKVV